MCAKIIMPKQESRKWELYLCEKSENWDVKATLQDAAIAEMKKMSVNIEGVEKK